MMVILWRNMIPGDEWQNVNKIRFKALCKRNSVDYSDAWERMTERRETVNVGKYFYWCTVLNNEND